MEKFVDIGTELRRKIKELIYDYMKNNPDCQLSSKGIRQTVIFRECGLDWGDKKKATSTHQQYWVIAALRELESEEFISQDTSTNLWTLTKQPIK